MISLLSRLGALLLLVGLITLTAIAVVVPVNTRISGLQERLENERALIGRFREVSDGKATVEQYAKNARSILETVEFLEGKSEGLQAANLQTRLTAIASRSGGQLRTSRAMPTKEQDGLRFVGVELQIACSNEQMKDFLQAIETERLPMIVERLQISALPPRGSNSGFRLLDLRVQVFAPVPINSL